MVGSVDEIARVAVTNATAIREVSEAIRQQLAALGETAASAQLLTEGAHEVRALLRRFRTDEPVGGRGAEAGDLVEDAA
jgi:methyl-accepting chemotaxis protein